MSMSSAVVSSGPNSTLSMLQSMIQSWQTKSQQQIDNDILSLKAQASSMSPGFVFVGQSSSSKLTTAIIQVGLGKGGASGNSNYEAWSQDYVAGQQREFTAENSMTSDQIQSALYSGQGIQDQLAKDDGQEKQYYTFNFSSLLSGLKSGNNPYTALADQLGKAIADHTLTVQKASDVAGLDYHLNIMAAASGGGSTGGWDESWNHAVTGITQEDGKSVSNVAEDGKHHFLMNATGYLGLYFSW